jgi:hypothetical protein
MSYKENVEFCFNCNPLIFKVVRLPWISTPSSWVVRPWGGIEMGGVGKHHPHLLGNRHEQIIEDFKPYGIYVSSYRHTSQ